MGLIKSEFDQIVRNAIIRFANANNADLQKISLLLYLNDAGEPAFLMQLNYKGVKEMTILELLDRKVDFLDRKPFVEQFVKIIFDELMQEHSLTATEIRIMLKVVPTERKGVFKTKMVQMVLGYLYKGVAFVKQLDMNELLSDVKLMTAQL